MIDSGARTPNTSAGAKAAASDEVIDTPQRYRADHRRIFGPIYLHMRFAIRRRFLAFLIYAVAVSAAANDADYSQRLTALVNQYRASRGIPALVFDKTLAGLAGEHSAAMA